MKRKIAVSVPDAIVSRVEQEVKAGRARSVSAYVSDALEEKARYDTLSDILAEMDRERGKPSRRDKAWARRVLGP